MDEERLRMRREMVRQARQGKTKTTKPETGNFFLFRIYVTMMLVGAAFVLSFFETETTNTITKSLKEAIAYEMPLETIEEWKQKVVSVFQQNTNKIQNTQQQNNQQEQIKPQDTQQENQDIQQNTTEPKKEIKEEQQSNAFQPDLKEESGKIP